MAHVNTYGVHYPIWIDAAPTSVGWGAPASNYKMEASYFGNFVVTGGMNHGTLQAPLGYYCQGDDMFNGRPVPGRVGDQNPVGAAPYYDFAGGGTTCAGSRNCTAHSTNGVIDGYSDCADGVGGRFTNPLTVWRDPNAAFTMDTSYIYSIRARLGAVGTAVNVSGGDYSNGNNMLSYRFVPRNKMGIQDSGAGNGTYKVFFWENPGMCLENPANQTANGTRPQLGSCSAATNAWQQWNISVDTGTGAMVLQNRGSGNCLDDSGSTNPGTMPTLSDCDSTNDQKWRVNGGQWKPYWTSVYINPAASYTLLAGNGAGQNALDSGGNYSAGAHPALASTADPDKNEWLIIKPGSATGTFKITFAQNPNKCLDHPSKSGSGDGLVMQVWDCNGGTNQNWTFSNAQNGGVVIKNQWSGKCLDSGNSSSSTNSAALQT